MLLSVFIASTFAIAGGEIGSHQVNITKNCMNINLESLPFADRSAIVYQAERAKKGQSDLNFSVSANQSPTRTWNFSTGQFSRLKHNYRSENNEIINIKSEKKSIGFCLTPKAADELATTLSAKEKATNKFKVGNLSIDLSQEQVTTLLGGEISSHIVVPEIHLNSFNDGVAYLVAYRTEVQNSLFWRDLEVNVERNSYVAIRDVPQTEFDTYEILASAPVTAYKLFSFASTKVSAQNLVAVGVLRFCSKEAMLQTSTVLKSIPANDCAYGVPDQFLYSATSFKDRDALGFNFANAQGDVFLTYASSKQGVLEALENKDISELVTAPLLQDNQYVSITNCDIIADGFTNVAALKKKGYNPVAKTNIYAAFTLDSEMHTGISTQGRLSCSWKLSLNPLMGFADKYKKTYTSRRTAKGFSVETDCTKVDAAIDSLPVCRL